MVKRKTKIDSENTIHAKRKTMRDEEEDCEDNERKRKMMVIWKRDGNERKKRNICVLCIEKRGRKWRKKPTWRVVILGKKKKEKKITRGKWNRKIIEKKKRKPIKRIEKKENEINKKNLRKMKRKPIKIIEKKKN